MGNVLIGSDTVGKAGAAIAVFEASDPAIMQTEVQTLVDALIQGATDGIGDIALAGAGDGHSFVCTVLHGPNASRVLGANTTVRCYMAGSQPELSAKMTAALQAITGTQLIVGHAEAGSALGRRWMGILVSQDP